MVVPVDENGQSSPVSQFYPENISLEGETLNEMFSDLSVDNGFDEPNQFNDFNTQKNLI